MAPFLKLLRVRFTEPTKPKQFSGEHVRLGNPWHAVSIVPGAGCCSAAREASGRRYLSSEMPPALPLKDCPMAACTCRYRHHDDRRSSRQAQTLPPTEASAPRRRAEDSSAH